MLRAIHSKRGRPRREPDYENAEIGIGEKRHPGESDIEIVIAGLSNLTSFQFRRLSIIIASRMGRPPSVVTGQEQRNINGARAHQLIEECRNSRDRQDTRLRDGGPYAAVMGDAQKLFGCSQRTLERDYKEFKERRDDGRVDNNGNYVDFQPLDDEYRESEAS